MGTFAAGEVVLLPFPFSDLTGNKLRPALLLANVDRGDWIACQINAQVLMRVRDTVVAMLRESPRIS